MEKKKTHWLKTFAKGWTGSFIIALLVATSFKSAIADWNDIPTGSMQPTILIGDRVLINKLAYDLKIPYTTKHLARWADPQRGDIVVFYSPKDGKRLIKRVVGLPGDTIAMKRNRLAINGKFLDYEALPVERIDQIDLGAKADHTFYTEELSGTPHTVMLSPGTPSYNNFRPVLVPEGQYIMLGDNRDQSGDSRFFGFVERKQIVGRSTKVGISRNGSFLNPRWERFFQDLT